MGFDWSTFVLETINFLVLVWLLRHFLYRPVLAMIEQRQRAVQQTLDDAQKARDEARALQADYQARNTQWQVELEQRRQALGKDLEAERQRRMQALQADLAAEQQRQQALRKHEQEACERAAQTRAAGQAARFASRLLHDLATPALAQRIFEVALRDLAALPPDRVEALHSALASARAVVVQSSAPLAADQRARLEATLAAWAATLPDIRYAEDTALVCGLRIRIDAWELDASIAGELRAFAEADGHG
ncbi:F0F1 ATP synthase subunit delta [Rhodanobacter aciditrophus]|uniref:F0F1 ATP synthase subunit delta n=1 Tax=Rhodanobacter aciditrophus TaxID=1623218 RepID=UPI003CFB1478